MHLISAILNYRMKKMNSLSKQGLYIIGLLVVQYLLGMYTNMFVAFPENKHEGQLWQFAWHQPSLVLHILVGFSLLFGAISLVVRSIKQKNKSWIYASSIGTIAILSGISVGALFIPTQIDIYSFLMAISFIIAFIALGWGIYASKDKNI